MVPTKLGQTILFCSFTYYKEKFGEFGGFSELPNYTYLFIISFLIPLRSMGSKTPMLPVPKRQSVVFFHVHVHIILSKNSTVLIEFQYVVEIGVFSHHRLKVCTTLYNLQYVVHIVNAFIFNKLLN